MKKISVIILLLIGLSWITSLVEGLRCDEMDHQDTAQVIEETTEAHDLAHPCHAGSCHFGHCAHLDARMSSTSIDQPVSFLNAGPTPYAFALRTEPITLPMRPPLAV